MKNVLVEGVSHPTFRQQLGLVLWMIQGYGLGLVTFLAFFPRLHHVQEYLFFFLLLGAVAAVGVDCQAMWVRSPIDVALFAYVGWVLLTIPFATDPAYSFSEWRKLAAQVLVFFWAFRLATGVDSEGVMRRVMAAVLLGTLVLSSYALIDFVSQGGSWKGRGIRARAPYSDCNALTTYMVLVIPIVLSLVLSAKDRWLRTASGVAVGLAALAQLFTYTRAGWVASVSQQIIFWVYLGRRKLLLWMGAAAVLLVIGLGVLSYEGYQQGVTSTHSFFERVDVWEIGALEVMSHPLVGMGYGDATFMKLFAERPEAGLAAGLHSTFLMIAMGSGMPALMLFLAVFATAMWKLISRSRDTSDFALRVFFISVAIMIFGFGLRNVFDHMFVGSLAYLFWILTAVGLARTMSGPNGIKE